MPAFWRHGTCAERIPSPTPVQPSLADKCAPAEPSDHSFEEYPEVDKLRSENSEAVGTRVRPRTRKALSLSAIEAFLRRCFLNDHDLKRRSSPASGNSQQEIARRAELKRLRNERIREELTNERLSKNVGRKGSRTIGPTRAPERGPIKDILIREHQNRRGSPSVGDG
jgi:hypothetical protein